MKLTCEHQARVTRKEQAGEGTVHQTERWRATDNTCIYRFSQATQKDTAKGKLWNRLEFLKIKQMGLEILGFGIPCFPENKTYPKNKF